MMIVKAMDKYLVSASNCCTKGTENLCGINYRTNA